MHRVVVVGNQAGELVRLLKEYQLPELTVCPPEAESALADAEILFGAPDALAGVLDEAGSVRWVQSSWAGVRPLVSLPRRDYTLTGVRGIFGQAMTEYVVGWLLGLQRGIIRRAHSRCWDGTLDPGVHGRHIGILGTGDIARAVARGCRALGMTVRGLNSTGRAVAPFDACFATTDRLAFADGLDYLLALLPATPATDNLVDAGLLARLAPGAIFLNTGRANCVVDADLLDALASGRLRAAVLDVTREEPLPPDHAFWGVDGLYLTSHTAAPTAPAAIVALFAENYRRFISGEPLLHRVDFERGY